MTAAKETYSAFALDNNILRVSYIEPRTHRYIYGAKIEARTLLRVYAFLTTKLGNATTLDITLSYLNNLRKPLQHAEFQRSMSSAC